MKILITGASGFIGKPLVSYFRSQSHHVVPFKRSETSCQDLEGFDAVIHLAGEPLTLGRWGKRKKERILQSRRERTALLANALVKLKHPPKVFISASAVGFYGDRGEELLTEESGEGKGFLPEVCRQWEEASQVLERRGVRRVMTRFGMVLGPGGGALKMILPIYKLGLGGRLGSGEQWMSWVDREDLIRALDWVLRDESISGPVNVVSPQPVRQKEFSRCLAECLRRPANWTVSSWFLRMALGVCAEGTILASAKAIPAKLLASGFFFGTPQLRDSLRKVIQ